MSRSPYDEWGRNVVGKNEKINVISIEEKTVDRRVRGGQRQLVGEGRTRTHTHTHTRAAHNNNKSEGCF